MANANTIIQVPGAVTSLPVAAGVGTRVVVPSSQFFADELAGAEASAAAAAASASDALGYRDEAETYRDDAAASATQASGSATAAAADTATVHADRLAVDAAIAGWGAGTGLTLPAASRAVLAGVPWPAGGPAYLYEAGREGHWVPSTADLSAQVAADPNRNRYQPPASDATGASGAWVRVVNGELNIKAMGALGGGTNDQAAIQAACDAAIALGVEVVFPAGTWIVTALTWGAGLKVRTAGAATVIKQAAGTAASNRIVSITGYVECVNGLTVEGLYGQTGDTTDEQNHGIFCQANAATGSFIGPLLGNIVGRNLRGDALYLGTTAGYTLFRPTFGNVTVDNVQRNGVAVAGNVYGGRGGVVGLAPGATYGCGLREVDLEQNVGTGAIVGFHIAGVRGRFVGCVAPTGTDYLDAISFGFIDLSYTRHSGANPAYAPGASQSHALQVRNCKSLSIGKFRAEGYPGVAIAPVASLLTTPMVVTIDYAESWGNNTAGSAVGNFGGGAGIEYRIGSLDGDVLQSGNFMFYQCVNAHVGRFNVALTTLAWFANSCTGLQAGSGKTTVSGGGAGGGVLQACTGCTIRAGNFTGQYLISNCSGSLVENTTATNTVDYVHGSGTNNSFRKVTFGGLYSEHIYYASGTTLTYQLDGSGTPNFGAAVKVNGTKVVGTRQSAITTPSGGATVDTEGRAAIASILTAMRNHGLIS